MQILPYSTIHIFQMFVWIFFFIFSPLVLSKLTKTTTIDRVQALWNFEEVTQCILHHNALIYNNYGCWCGVGGSHEPVDEIDRCCMHHDKCYDAAVDTKVCFDVAWEYVDNYNWKCINSTAVCEENQDRCKNALCNCDREVVECWKQYPKPEEKKRCNRSKMFLRKQVF